MKIKLSDVFAVLFVISATANTAFAHNKVVVIPLEGEGAKLVTRTITQNFSAGHFNAAFSDEDYFINVGEQLRFLNNSTTTSLGLSTSIDLPQGAEIKKLTCYVEDKDNSIDFGFGSSAEINRRLKTSTTTEAVETNDLILTTSGNSAGLQALSITAFTNPVIDNKNYFYTMYVFFQVATSGGGFVTPPFTADVKFYGCSLDYELDVVTAP